MIEMKKQPFDSDTPVICDWCKATIADYQDKIIYGTGNALLMVYHPHCDWERQEQGTLTKEG